MPQPVILPLAQPTALDLGALLEHLTEAGMPVWCTGARNWPRVRRELNRQGVDWALVRTVCCGHALQTLFVSAEPPVAAEDLDDVEELPAEIAAGAMRALVTEAGGTVELSRGWATLAQEMRARP
jgi:hypothetical protein